MSKPRSSLIEFGPFRLDPGRRLLLRDEAVVALPPKAFDTLLALIENCDRVLEKSELMSAVWPDSFVEEANLPQTVSVLRRALGERAGEHRYIVTVPGRGYRFVASVSEPADQGADLIYEDPALPQGMATREEGATNAELTEIEQNSDQQPIGLTREHQPSGQMALVNLASTDRRISTGWVNTIAKAVAVMALGAIGLFVYRYLAGPAEPHASAIHSIAVLPLKNLTDDPAQDYYSDGMTESLITALSKIEGLKVISRG